MKYLAFQQIIDTMKNSGYDYQAQCEEMLSQAKKRKEGETFPIQKHIRALIYAQLSNQRPWKQIVKNSNNIDAIFHNYDLEYLKQTDPDIFTSKLKQIKCGNRQIQKQMLSLKENISTLEKIEAKYGSIDNYYNSQDTSLLVIELSSGRYKMKQMGRPLISEYLKTMGIDIIKPDVHVCRILGRLGYTDHSPAQINEAFEVCNEIAQEYNICNIEVDSILWQYCANGYFEQCIDKPNCSNCFVENCINK